MRFPARTRVLKRASILLFLIVILYFTLRFYTENGLDVKGKLQESSPRSKIESFQFETTVKTTEEYEHAKKNDFVTQKTLEMDFGESNEIKDAFNQNIMEGKVTTTKQAIKAAPCPNIHIFYYPWYCNLKNDGEYRHWNHQTLPHWDKVINQKYDKKTHEPPNDIASSFYPDLGPYSSRDPDVIERHFEQIVEAGAGVIVVSYYPPGQGDDNGKSWDDVHFLLLEKAVKHNIKVTFQIEPYKNRNEETVRKDVLTIIKAFGNHDGFYKHKLDNGDFRPLIYVYDSYQTKPEEWSRVLTHEGHNTIRGTKYDAMFIGLFVELDHVRYVTVGGFDGMYTYFATNGFTYGSTWQNWRHISTNLHQLNSLFVPSVGPGYDDTSIRPWNGENTRDRANGAYYKNSWKTALEMSPKIITITSFNEWHEGTQIEKAVPKVSPGRIYNNYRPFSPDHYLKLTRKFREQFKSCDSVIS